MLHTTLCHLILFLFICVYICILSYVFVCMCVYLYCRLIQVLASMQRSEDYFWCSSSPSTLFDTGSLCVLSCVDSVGFSHCVYQTGGPVSFQGFPCLTRHLPVDWSQSGLYVGSGDSNTDPHTFKENTFTHQGSPQAWATKSLCENYFEEKCRKCPLRHTLASPLSQDVCSWLMVTSPTSRHHRTFHVQEFLLQYSMTQGPNLPLTSHSSDVESSPHGWSVDLENVWASACIKIQCIGLHSPIARV